MNGFKRYEEDFIFIAASSDVRPARERVENLVKAQLAHAGLDRISVYSWDKDPDIVVSGFDARRSMQGNLPRPTAPNCLAVLCLFGERIGLPLEDEFDVKQIANVERWMDPGHQHRLVHPWPHDEEDANSLLREGAYPLTGTVFEFLDAHGASKPPLWIALLADRRITELNPDVVLNGKSYLNQLTGELGPEATANAVTEGEYFRQTRGVRNFMLALARASIATNCLRLDTTAFDHSVRYFVVSKLIGKRAKRHNPYHKLRYYDIDEGDDFEGRDDFVRDAVNALQHSRPSIFRVVGPSGIGKSSVLRAGILRRFREDAEHRGRYACLAVRLEDFYDNGHVMPVIGTLLDLITVRTHIELPRREVAELRWKGAMAPTLAVDLIRRTLASGQGPSHLIVGLDQFEEIVDELSDAHEGDCWRPLLAFVNAAVSLDSISFVYTLESSRRVAHDALRLGPAFENAVELPLDDNSASFISTVIAKPFRKAGFSLSNAMVKELRESFEQVRANDDREAGGAALPLLALHLTQLFDDVQNRFEPDFEQSEAGGALRSAAQGARADAGESEGISREQLIRAGVRLAFDPVIGGQAERAWRQATGSSKVDDLDLDQFLQPFVGSTRGGRLQLRIIPNTFAGDDHQALSDAFLRARLLARVRDRALRIVHEAVIYRWEAARRWFETRQNFLIMKEGYYRGNLDSVPSPPSEAQIGQAAEVLAAHYRSWMPPNASLAPEDERLRAYCLAVFRMSDTPTRPVVAFPRERNHVALAALYGLSDLLRKFGTADPECINSPDPGSSVERRPLNHAAWCHLTAVETLLELGADPIAHDQDGWPAIALAIDGDQREICHVLLEQTSKRIGPNLQSLMHCPNGETLLHVCAAQNRPELAEIFTSLYRFDPRAVNNEGWTPLHTAAYAGHEATFRFFANHHATAVLTSKNQTVLHLAAYAGRAALGSLILEQDSTLASARDLFGDTPLHYAVSQGHPALVRSLLPFSDPNQENDRGSSALTLALDSRRAEVDEENALAVLSALLDDGRTSLSRVDVGWLERPFQALLLKDIRLDLTKVSGREAEPLFFLLARRKMWLELERFMMSSVTDWREIVTKRSETLLHRLAAENAPVNLLDSFLKGIDRAQLNRRNLEDRTALDVALRNGNWPCTQRLLNESSIELTRISEKSIGSLGFAIEQNASTEWITSHLLTRSPTLASYADLFGWTPLHHAAAHQLDQRLDALCALPGHSNDQWLNRDSFGRTPTDLLAPASRARYLGTGLAAAWPPPRTWDGDVRWAELGPDEHASVLTKIKALRDPSANQDELKPTCRIDWGVLGCYPQGVRLLRVFDPSWASERRRLYFVQTDDSLVALTGASAVIHDLNGKPGTSPAIRRSELEGSADEPFPEPPSLLQLTADTVLEYLRFFCFFVHGNDGPFLILESTTHPELRPDLPTSARQLLQKRVHPSWLRGEQDGAFYVAAPVLYGSGLFSADFRVTKTGLVEMLDDETLESFSELGSLMDCPIA